MKLWQDVLQLGSRNHLLVWLEEHATDFLIVCWCVSSQFFNVVWWRIARMHHANETTYSKPEVISKHDATCVENIMNVDPPAVNVGESQNIWCHNDIQDQTQPQVLSRRWYWDLTSPLEAGGLSDSHMKGLSPLVFSRTFCPVSSSVLSISDSGYQKAQVPLGWCLSVIFTSSALLTMVDSCSGDKQSDSPLASTSVSKWDAPLSFTKAMKHREAQFPAQLSF